MGPAVQDGIASKHAKGLIDPKQSMNFSSDILLSSCPAVREGMTPKHAEGFMVEDAQLRGAIQGLRCDSCDSASTLQPKVRAEQKATLLNVTAY